MKSFAFFSLFATFAASAQGDSFPAARAVLEQKCVSCHNPEKTKGGLLMTDKAAFMKGGENGVIVTPGDATKSPLVQRTLLPKGHEDIMPPKGDPLSPAETDALKNWVAAGAAWPEGVTLKVVTEADLLAQNEARRKEGQIRSVEMFPPQVNLETKRDWQQVIVFATYQDDTTADVTSLARLSLSNPALASVDGSTLKTGADGEGTLTAQYAGKNVSVPVKVTAAAQEREVSFKLDVMPVFMRNGCNSGGCHGSARGKDGFHLSLFGYDAEGDYQSITRQMNGRRINLAIPEESLLIEKGIQAVPHSGNKLFEKDSSSYKTLVEWIQKGALKDEEKVASVTGIEIFPKQIVMEGSDLPQQMLVRATYSDGTDRDVTHLAVFITNNESSVKAAKSGLLTSGERGEAFIMARFDTFAQGTQAIVIPRSLNYQKPQPLENNYIDQLVDAKLHKLRILPSDLCSDEIFLRRASLDVAGVMPTPEEFEAFVKDTAPDKRAKLVDALLNRKEFTEMWVMKWAELLQIESNAEEKRSYKSILLYHNWLQDKIARNVPMNEIVVELLSSSGGTFTNPSSNYYEMEKETLKVTENVAQVFMGMRIQCAQCHNHPFDKWTMNDYYGFNGFFTQVGRKPAEDPREIIIFNSGGGESQHPVTKKPVKPKFLGGEEPETAGKDRRRVLAEWLASPKNPYFARNLANLIWSQYFGIGIIEPVDDVRISNPASNPELLDALSQKLTEYNYDFKRLVRDICTSATYQRTTVVNATNQMDTRNFSHARVRRVRAEVLLDGISQVTDTSEKFKGLPLGARAVQIADGNVSNYFLTTFGRATRESVCSCEVKMEPNLSQALHLLNGATTQGRIAQGKLVPKMIEAKKTNEEIIGNLYIRTFARKPTETEMNSLKQQIDAVPPADRAKILEDLFWAMLNAKEFMFNH